MKKRVRGVLLRPDPRNPECSPTCVLGIRVLHLRRCCLPKYKAQYSLTVLKVPLNLNSINQSPEIRTSPKYVRRHNTYVVKIRTLPPKYVLSMYVLAIRQPEFSICEGVAGLCCLGMRRRSDDKRN